MRVFVVILTVAMAIASARAEEAAGLTLEWLADTCPYIGIFHVESSSAISDMPGYVHINALLRDALRGEPPKEFKFDYPGTGPGCNEGQAAPVVGDRFLIFLRDAGPKDIRWEQIISLTRPLNHCSNYVALRPDCSLLIDGKQIEQVIRERIAHRAIAPLPWREYPRELSDFRIQPGTPAYEAINAGSSCYLVVPDDLRGLCREPGAK